MLARDRHHRVGRPCSPRPCGTLPHLVAAAALHVERDVGHHGRRTIVAERRVHVMAIDGRLLADTEVEPGQRRVAVLAVLAEPVVEVDARPPAALNAVDLFLRPVGKVEVEQHPGRAPHLRVAEVVEVVEPLDQRGVVAVAHHLDAHALACPLPAVGHEILVPGPVVLRRRGAVVVLQVLVFGPVLGELGEVPADGEVHGMMVL